MNADIETISDQVRTYWDLDAATYDHSAGHNPTTALELAVWAAALRRLLPPPPARVLDVGAGTGFLSIILARQGYEVSALDLSPGMLGQLRDKAARSGLSIHTVEANSVRSARRRLRRDRRAPSSVDPSRPPECPGSVARFRTIGPAAPSGEPVGKRGRAGRAVEAKRARRAQASPTWPPGPPRRLRGDAPSPLPAVRRSDP